MKPDVKQKRKQYKPLKSIIISISLGIILALIIFNWALVLNIILWSALGILILGLIFGDKSTYYPPGSGGNYF